MEVEFSPQQGHRNLPVEVLDRSELMARLQSREVAIRQRVGFHQLLLCTEGTGRHIVDFEPVELSPGTVLRIYPGQVQQFVPDAAFEAAMVVWPVESHHADPTARPWYPGSDVPTRWTLDDALAAKLMEWVDELRLEQARYQDSPLHSSLLQALLCALLMRLAIEVPGTSPEGSRLPQAYVDYREIIEEMLYERPTVVSLADRMGYSTRTLDRACHQVAGTSARDVLDERIALEVRRLLTHTNRPITRIAADVGFSDSSNFSKFVKRHLGRLPSEIREQPDGR
ncbi:MAG: helix-turn-helix transcriptional regulator [Actinomycetota bacterium]